MVHERFEFAMPASAEVVFDTFHYHHWRRRWDSLVHATHVFPFASWAASMRHRPGGDAGSIMVYTYRFETAPAVLRFAMEPVTKLVFDWQTRKRFLRMQRFLAAHAAEVEAWQRQGRPS